MPEKANPPPKLYEEGEMGNVGNILTTRSFPKSDVSKGFSEAEVIIKNVYRPHYQEHAFIETEGAVALPEHGGIVIYSSCQCPFYVRNAVAEVLDLPLLKVRMVQATIGDTFGGKEDVSSEICNNNLIIGGKS